MHPIALAWSCHGPSAVYMDKMKSEWTPFHSSALVEIEKKTSFLTQRA